MRYQSVTYYFAHTKLLIPQYIRLIAFSLTFPAHMIHHTCATIPALTQFPL